MLRPAILPAITTLALLGLAFIPPTRPDARERLLQIQLRNCQNQIIRPFQVKEAKALVFIFISTDCPIANGYAPEIRQISEDYSSRQVVVYPVLVDNKLKPEQGAKHLKEYHLPETGLLDPEQKLASAVQAYKTPEAFLFTPDGELKYRGRIDNRYSDFGKMRHSANIYDLRLSLEAVLAGRPVPRPRTDTIGCFLPPKPETKKPPKAARKARKAGVVHKGN